MKQFQKWQRKFAEAKSAEEFIEIMHKILYTCCEETPDEYCDDLDNECYTCRENWFDSEVKEDDAEREDTEHDTK